MKIGAILSFAFLVMADVHAMPSNTRAADYGFEARKANLVKAWVLRYKNEASGNTFYNLGGFPPWTTKGSTVLREMGAGFSVFANPKSYPDKYLGYLSGLSSSASFNQHLSAYQTAVGNYLSTWMYQYCDMGSDIEDRDGDYDFVLNDVVSLLYGFLDRPDLLTNEMAFHLVTQNMSLTEAVNADQDISSDILSPWGYGSWGTIGYKVRISETENHLLMIYSWKYLINNYIRWVATLPSTNPRYDSRLAAIFNSNPTRYTNNPGMNDLVLKLIGRIPHRGEFETDANAYEAFTYNALMNFYSYSAILFPNDGACAKVKTSAQNSLDYLSAAFAFESLEGKRCAPMRRNYTYRLRFGVYANDYIPNIIGALTGAYVFSDYIGEYEFTNSPGVKPPDMYKMPYFYLNIDQPGGFALWAALGRYRVPTAIEDLLLHKYNGWFMKAQSKFYADEYGANENSCSFLISACTPDDPDPFKPNYFGPHSNSLKPVSQSFFVTPDFVNSAGGISEQYLPTYSGPFAVSDEFGSDAYNSLAKPNTLIPKGDYGYAGSGDGDDLNALGNEVLLNGSSSGWSMSMIKILGTYKSFALASSYQGTLMTAFHSGHDLFHYPSSWDGFDAYDWTVTDGSQRLTILDLRNSNTSLNGYYLILMALKTNSGLVGFWEVVPGSKYSDANSVAAHVWTNTAFPVSGGVVSSPCVYKLASTGEKITFTINGRYGTDDPDSSPPDVRIGSIIDANGSEISSQYVFPNNSRPESTPLLTVWQVDQNYNFTGYKYAESPAEGRIIVRNPHLGGSELVVDINSTDYANPSNNNPARPPVKVNRFQTSILSLLLN